MKSKLLDYAVRDGVASIMLNRPDSLNSINLAVRLDLLAAIGKAENDPKVRVIVFKGAGRGFCAGADLSEGLPERTDQMLENEYKPILVAIAESSKVCIAQVHGAAAGISAALVMVCDMVVMSHEAYIYLAFAAIGLVPDGGLTWHLVHALGYRKAFETIVEGRKMSADECLAHGIANQIVALDELEEAVAERAGKIAAGAPLAQAALKRILRAVGPMTMAEAISLEAGEQQPLTQSADCRNAIDAFFRKEKPVFKGE